jgi:hypothetical protein
MIRVPVSNRSSDTFEDNERPTAKRDRPDAVDLANASNKTQELNPRELLGAAMLEKSAADAAAPSGLTSGTQRVPEEAKEGERATPDDAPKLSPFERATIEMQNADAPAAPAPEAELPVVVPRTPLFVVRHEGRLMFTPALVAVAVALALIAGFVASRVL